jgi:hypothetical protein
MRLSDSRLARHLLAFGLRTQAARVSHVTQMTLPYVPSPLPRRTQQVLVLAASLLAQAFPFVKEGQRPHEFFRGLLGVHSRYGPQACSTA